MPAIIGDRPAHDIMAKERADRWFENNGILEKTPTAATPFPGIKLFSERLVGWDHRYALIGQGNASSLASAPVPTECGYLSPP